MTRHAILGRKDCASRLQRTNLRDNTNNGHEGDYLVYCRTVASMLCKVYFNFCFQSTGVSSSWSIGHSEKSVTIPSGKTEETRFQGSASRFETSCQLMQDSGYVQRHSRSVFSTLPPVPNSSSIRLPTPYSLFSIPHPPSPIPHPPSPIPHPPVLS